MDQQGEEETQLIPDDESPLPGNDEASDGEQQAK
jgi:hypothetical protein